VEEEEVSLFVHHTFHLAGASDVVTSATKKAMVRKTLSIGVQGSTALKTNWWWWSLEAKPRRRRTSEGEFCGGRGGEEEFCGGRGGEADVGAPPATGSFARR
jgi:hypothetical protein